MYNSLLPKKKVNKKIKEINKNSLLNLNSITILHFYIPFLPENTWTRFEFTILKRDVTL